MNVKEGLLFGKKYLDEAGIQDSTLKVRMILSEILNMEKEKLLIKDLQEITKSQEIKFKEFLVRLADNEPIQYILNKQEFMKLNFFVDENVLIPQPDTENIVYEVLDICKNNPKKIKILDLCTGSGAIAISIAKYMKDCEIYASDISYEALEIAKRNAVENKVKLNFLLSDLFESIPNTKFDIIVSNPPYIKTNIIDTLSEEVKKEPRLALDGGADGLDFYKKIARSAEKFLKKDGTLLLEIGYDQKESVISILENKSYKDIECKKDLSKNDRIIKCRRK